jgi:hypothetical protein
MKSPALFALGFLALVFFAYYFALWHFNNLSHQSFELVEFGLLCHGVFTLLKTIDVSPL